VLCVVADYVITNNKQYSWWSNCILCWIFSFFVLEKNWKEKAYIEENKKSFDFDQRWFNGILNGGCAESFYFYHRVSLKRCPKDSPTSRTVRVFSSSLTIKLSFHIVLCVWIQKNEHFGVHHCTDKKRSTLLHSYGRHHIL